MDVDKMNGTPTTAPLSDPKTTNRARFELELEFVQALANPFYLHSLAQQNVLEQPAFVNFLEYLLYWKEKDYARFIQCANLLCFFGIVEADLGFLEATHMLCTTSSCYSMLNSDPR